MASAKKPKDLDPLRPESAYPGLRGKVLHLHDRKWVVTEVRRYKERLGMYKIVVNLGWVTRKKGKLKLKKGTLSIMMPQEKFLKKWIKEHTYKVPSKVQKKILKLLDK